MAAYAVTSPPAPVALLPELPEVAILIPPAARIMLFKGVPLHLMSRTVSYQSVVYMSQETMLLPGWSAEQA